MPNLYLTQKTIFTYGRLEASWETLYREHFHFREIEQLINILLKESPKL